MEVLQHVQNFPRLLGPKIKKCFYYPIYSSHYTRQEMFINGVRKECRSRFRAFMEYAGPEGGFCIRWFWSLSDTLKDFFSKTD